MTEQHKPGTDVLQKRLTQIFQFLKALHETRHPVQREIKDQPWTLWFRDLPNHPAVRWGGSFFDRQATGDDNEAGRMSAADLNHDSFILSVRRPVLSPAPPPPAELSPWLEPGWEQPENDEVTIRAAWTEVEAGVEKTWAFEDDPQRPDLLEQWLRDRREWVRTERPARKAMEVFQKLYNLRAMLDRENERLELMLGDGVLVWNRDDLPMHHPVLLQRLQIDFDPTIPEFRLIEAEHPPELYTALFRAAGEVSAQAIGRLRDDLAANMWHPLGGEHTSEFLKRVATELSPLHGEFVGDGSPALPGSGLRIGRDPVVFVRLKTLGFGIAVESILDDIPNRSDLSGALGNIVGVDLADHEHDDGEKLFTPEDPNGEDEEILLSKEANTGQLEIARRLARYGAVLVQGPPGTGKTHTIANLLGHLLAQGKSVLVTAHTTKALRVLRNHVVEPLRPLCVSVLDGSSTQLEDSVDEISSRLAEASADLLDREAAVLEQQRRHVLGKLRQIRSKLLDARESEYRAIVVGGTENNPSQAARLVAAGAGEHSWIPSPVEPGASLPLSPEQLADLYRTNQVLSEEDERELSTELPVPESIVLPSDFAALCSRRSSLVKQQLDHRADLWGDVHGNPSHRSLVDLAERITREVLILGDSEPWQLTAIMAGREGGPLRQAWEDLLQEIESVWSCAAQVEPLMAQYGPQLPEDCLPGRLMQTLKEMAEHLRAGAKFSRMQLFVRREWKTVLEQARVNGQAPQDADDIEALIAYVELRHARQRLVQRWERQMSALDGPSAESLGPEPEKACRQFVSYIERALNWMNDFWSPMETALRQEGLKWDSLMAEIPPDLSPFGELIRLREAVLSRLPSIVAARTRKLELREIDEQLKSLKNLLELSAKEHSRSSTVRQLLDAVNSLNPVAYQASFERLVDLQTRSKVLEQRQDLLERLGKVAPAWAAAIVNRQGVHGGSTIPGDPMEAWLWRQLSDELDRRGSVSLEDLQLKVEQLRSELLSTTAKLVEKRTWSAQIRRTTLDQRQALIGWKQLIARAGKRTGKRAPRLLAEARKLMPICQSAVPVWIMPLSQLVENFDPRTNRFDVVIIDEASQADVMALIALYMGKQVIIVGDPEQVTPDAVGQRLDEVQQLIDSHLRGIPNAQLYDGQTSIYDLAQRSFGGTVLLREHFRCVPDIIQFSNGLSYKGQIQPLRDASSVRLRPSTIAYRVHGTMSGRNVNEEEARTIASLLVAMTEQPEYDGATFGVMSLVGSEQALVIDELIQRYLQPSEYHRRRVQCGNPAQFQGDERDVILLSLVYSPSDRGPLRLVPDPGDRVRKRFNVAASRARDQLWVVHSVDPEADLQPHDIRRRLILHARDPGAVEIQMAQLAPRTQSEFEIQVLKRLIERGYRVTPQWKVGPYSIDLVVEDGTKRLAVECDGDRYHPPEQLGADMARQAILERLGWRFVRIRGSRFFRDPDEAMTPVFERLQALDIYPTSATADPLELPDSGTEELRERVVRRAEELRRLWDESEDRTVLVNGSRTHGEPIGDVVDHQAPQIEDHHAATPPADPESEPASFPSGGVTAEDKSARGSSLGMTAQTSLDSSRVVDGIEDKDSVSDSKQSPLQRTAKTQPSLSETELPAGQSDPVMYLRQQGYEVIDKRPVGGALWVVGGPELAEMLNSLQARGVRFTFAKNGGKATKKRPAWFTK